MFIQKNEDTNLKGYMEPHVYCNVVYNSEDIETTYVCLDEGIDKENVAYLKIVEAGKEGPTLPKAHGHLFKSPRRDRSNYKTSKILILYHEHLLGTY